VTKSNLAANLWADSGMGIIRESNQSSPSKEPHGKFKSFEDEVPVKVNPTADRASESSAENSELISLRQEVENLKQQLSTRKNISQANTALKTQVKNLKLELSQSESTAQALARSLQSQLQHNWEQQQHELMTSVAKLRSLDRERLEQQATQIQELHQQKLVLETARQELNDNLETALLNLAQNAKALQKMQASNGNSNRDAKNISLQSVLEQSIRSLQNEYTCSQNRIKDLETQIGELQEQILQQSAQATEYEAAIQHWKEKCLIHQNHALQLSVALERFIDGKDIPKIGESPKVDLPSFLVRPLKRKAETN